MFKGPTQPSKPQKGGGGRVVQSSEPKICMKPPLTEEALQQQVQACQGKAKRRSS